MRFEVEASPATTPSWRSNAWNRQQGGAREASPELGKGGDAGDETEWEIAGEQARPLLYWS